ncbi:unnamed protein product [Effrenium voratum]|nr:unnamed protein product [Effrenium voratum]
MCRSMRRRFALVALLWSLTSPPKGGGRLFLPSFGAEIVQTFFEEAETIRRVGAFAARTMRASDRLGSADPIRGWVLTSEPRKKEKETKRTGREPKPNGLEVEEVLVG